MYLSMVNPPFDKVMLYSLMVVHALKHLMVTIQEQLQN
ncbi:hypothetical protein VCSRO69_3656 [Vibrio cholerae]|nr:hypothetical protein VCSRO69_3656 [Vibrio cholerae]